MEAEQKSVETEKVWFLGWTPDGDSQIDDERMRVGAQSRWA
jgi:hypothetical protein